MKSLRGLWKAIGSTSPRNAVITSTTTVRWKSSGWKSPVAESAAQTEGHAAAAAAAASRISSSAGLFQPMRDVMRRLPHPVVVITTLDHVYQQQQPPNDKESPPSPPPPPIPRAMTVSSFTSLTIEPVPHVTFNVTLPSRTHRALEACGAFNAHILEGNDHGAAVADRFTRGNLPPSPSPADEKEQEEEEGGLGILAGLEDLDVQVLGREEWQREWRRARDGTTTPDGKGASASASSSSSSIDGHVPQEAPAARSLRTVPMLRGRGVLHVLKCRYAKMLAPLSFGSDRHAIVIGEVVDIISSSSSSSGDSEPDTGRGDGLALAYADRAYRRMGEQLLSRKPDAASASGRCTIIGPAAMHIDTQLNKDED
ncbi:flavin reductase like domain-containing protein [Biscogniauxia mediterranea]|nr:flavin reductase like domain-containing protein [Biscogniauxia mediterranea]